jgi:hypothetical protein
MAGPKALFIRAESGQHAEQFRAVNQSVVLRGVILSSLAYTVV